MHGVVMLPRKRAAVSRFVPNFLSNFVNRMNSYCKDRTHRGTPSEWRFVNPYVCLPPCEIQDK